MFYTEGQTEALLYTRTGAREKITKQKVRSAIIGLAWCQARHACFVYLPAPVRQN